jgi:hypothetical protein
VVESDIDYPGDSGLLNDGARVLTRTMKKIDREPARSGTSVTIVGAEHRSAFRHPLTPQSGYAASGRKWRRTTRVRRIELQEFRITHPFHPLNGREFEALNRKEHGGEQRVCFLDKKDRQCEIPLSWRPRARGRSNHTGSR